MNKTYEYCKKTGQWMIAGSTALVAASAHAVVDTTAIVTSITDAITPIGAVAAAVVTLVVGVKVYKYIKQAL